MTAISNFTASGKRLWYDGVNWHEDNLDFFQVATTTNFSGYDVLYSPEKTTNFLCASFYPIVQYYPGKIYRPKKYYNINQLAFRNQDFPLIREILEELYSTRPKELYSYVFFPDTCMTVFKNEKTGWYGYPVSYFYFSEASMITVQGEPVGIKYRSLTPYLGILISKFSKENIRVNNDYKYHNSISTHFEVYSNGTWRAVQSGEMEIIPLANPYMYQYSLDRVLSTFDEMVNQLKKIKYYFAAASNAFISISATNRDGEKYYSSEADNYTRYYPMVWLVSDISSTGCTVNSAFAGLMQNYLYNCIVDFTVDTTKSPNPSSNPEDDDPNDDDDGSQGGGGGGDGDEGGDGDHDDTSDIIPKPPLPSISGSSNGLITAWNLSASQLESLATQLWEPDAWTAIKQYFTNPMGAILSLAIIPVAPATTSGKVHLGGYDTGISAQRLISDYVKFDCGSIPINRYYGSYLDYSPFTKISCYLPYIGEVDIDPDQVMQTTLGIEYNINCITGECVAILSADGSVFANYSGNCLKQLPICQTDMSSIIQASVQVCSTLISAGVGAASAGASEGVSFLTSDIKAVNAAESAVKAQSSLLGSVMSAKMNYKHSSQLGTGAGQLAPQIPFLTIIRPNLDLADNYKSFTGYPCNKNLMLSSLHGFTQAEAINLSVPSASLEEIAEIKELLLKGVIL